VEFVLVLPFLLVLLFGIIDFGIAVNNSSDLNQVAADTARRLAVNADPSFDPEAHVRDTAEDSISSAIDVDVSLPGGATPGSDRAVCVKLTMTRAIQIIPGFEGIGPNLDLSGKAAMRLEMPANFTGSGAAIGSNSACS
jgi:hypothetical protein